MLERLEDDLYSEDESDCEAEGISGYMPEADASGEALDDDDEEGTDDASSSALTIALFAGQYLLLDTIAMLRLLDSIATHMKWIRVTEVSLLDDNPDVDGEYPTSRGSPVHSDAGSDSGRSRSGREVLVVRVSLSGHGSSHTIAAIIIMERGQYYGCCLTLILL